MKLTPLVLAAGQGSRFGSTSKLLADLSGKPVLGWVFDALVAAGLESGFVALPDDRRAAALEVLLPPGYVAVKLPQSEIGMGLSLAALAQQVPADHAAMMVFGDQPLITSAALKALMDLSKGTRIARLVNGTTVGHPVLFPANLVEELKHLSGDEGPRHLIKQFGYEPVEVDDPLILCDVDTPEVLEYLRAHA